MYVCIYIYSRLHAIFPCLILGVQSIPQSIERSGPVKHTCECDQY